MQIRVWVASISMMALPTFHAEAADVPKPISKAWQDSMRHAFHITPTAAIRLNDSVPESPRMTALLNKAEARYAVNPQRFTHYSPKLGGLISLDNRVKAAGGLYSGSLNGLMPVTPYWNFLRYLRSNHSTRFDTKFVALGRLLAMDARVRNELVAHASAESIGPLGTVGAGILTAGGGTDFAGQIASDFAISGSNTGDCSGTNTNTGGSKGNGGGPNQIAVGPSSVPEPSSWLLMTVGLGFVGWSASRRLA